ALRLSNSYRPRQPRIPAPAPHYYENGLGPTVLFYVPADSYEPDWLGEIFEWLSCADEYSVTQRDEVGRVPLDASYVGRHRLLPRRPYAAIAMKYLARALAKVFPVA